MSRSSAELNMPSVFIFCQHVGFGLNGSVRKSSESSGKFGTIRAAFGGFVIDAAECFTDTASTPPNVVRIVPNFSELLRTIPNYSELVRYGPSSAFSNVCVE